MSGMTFSTDNRCFVSMSMIYLVLSGVWLLWQGALIGDGESRLPGIELFAVGFLLPLIYGLGAHMLPRFTGNPIAMGGAAWIQLAALNAGLLLMVPGTLTGRALAILSGAILIWLSFAVFAWRAWRVMWPRR